MQHFLAKSSVVLFIVLSLNTSALSLSPVVASELQTNELQKTTTLGDLPETQLLTLFQAVERLPKNLLKPENKVALDQFMLQNGVDLRFPGERQKRSLPWCVASITWVVTSTAFGIAKLAKLKQFIKAAGGAYKAAQNLIKIARGGRSGANLAEFGHTMMDLSSEILGIKDIQDNCK